ncbi:hypothetical protein BpHYR1_038202 [Brachionus plicatilis]|uniref:Uncharacterized protein n=1 Tax=Brachionus plicatilis TaxID=10195 RepID=A0A3M7TAD3_BRAPC|nr:hypothetical protein BpHYR1_038202 [Brachionus plicatilis]
MDLTESSTSVLNRLIRGMRMILKNANAQDQKKNNCRFFRYIQHENNENNEEGAKLSKKVKIYPFDNSILRKITKLTENPKNEKEIYYEKADCLFN